MSAAVRGFLASAGVLAEVFIFLWARKKWWLMPMVAVLLLFGILLALASASGIGPFIYTFF